MEGKSCEGHEVGLSVGESYRGYAKGGKAGGGAEVAIDELYTHVGKKTSDGGYGWVWIGRGGSVGFCGGGLQPRGGKRYKVERFYKLIRLFCLVVRIIPTGCEEFLNAGWWYFMGPPPKTSLFIQKVFDRKWY